MDLAKRGFIRMKHSGETLESGPSRSEQFVYVFVWRHTEECAVHVDKMPLLHLKRT